MGLAQRNYILVMLLSHSAGAIVLLILLIIPFRPWLDGARVMFVLFCELGTAAAFSISYSGLVCNPPDARQCKIITQHVLIVSWIVPFLLLLYVLTLWIFVWKKSSNAPAQTFATSISTTSSDGEKGSDDPWRPPALFITRPKQIKHASQSSSFYINSPAGRRSPNRNHAPTLDLRLDETTLLPSPYASPPTNVVHPPIQPQPGVWDAQSERMTQSSGSQYSSASATSVYVSNQVPVAGIPKSLHPASGLDASRNFLPLPNSIRPDWSQHHINNMYMPTQASNPISTPVQTYHLPSAPQPSNYYVHKQIISRPGERGYPMRVGSGAGAGSGRGRMLAPVSMR